MHGSFPLIVLLAFVQIFGRVCFSQTLTISPSPATVVKDQDLQITCTINDGSCPLLDWKKNDELFISVTYIGDSCTKLFGIPYPDFSCEPVGGSSCTYTLTRKNVQLNQNGEKWRCVSSTKTTSNTTVVVKVPITSVTMTTPVASQVNVSEGVSTLFICETSQGKPSATIQWYKQLGLAAPVAIINHIVTIPINRDELVVTKSTLTFFPERLDHNYKIYCTAYNNGVQNIVTGPTNRILFVSYPCDAPSIQSSSRDSTYRIIDGRSQTLTCTANGGRPLASLIWNCFNGNEKGSTTGTTVTKNVTWIADKSQEGHRCTCQPSYSISDWNQQAYVQITVLYPPSSPVFTVNGQTVSEKVSVIENRTVNIYCSSNSVPPATYTWSHRGTSASNGVLTLSNIQTDNNGTQYTCTAKNTMNSSQGTEEGTKANQFSLNVLHPPRSPHILYNGVNSQLIIPQQPLYVVKGDNFSIHCKFTSSNPEPSSYQWTGQTGNSNVLTVTGIQTNRSLTCRATNNMIPTGSSNEIGTGSVTVSAIAWYGPSPPTMIYNPRSSSSVQLQSELRVVTGTSFSVTCGGSDSNPAASYSWISPIISSSTERLNISYIDKRYDSTDLKCTAENDMDRTFGKRTHGESNSTLKLIVLYGPTVHSLPNVTVLENRTFTNTCQSEPGNPSETQYTWTLSDGSIHKQQTLSILRVTRTHMGMYKCEAWNNMNPTGELTAKRGEDSSTFWLNVLYGSSISHFTINGQSDTQSTFNHTSTLSISCLVDSNPGSTITIKKDNRYLPSVSDGVEATYTMTDVRCTDAGVYSCNAFNEYNGESRPTTQHNVTIRSPPVAVELEDNKTFFVAVHDSITISLTVCAYPLPSSILWYKLDNKTGSSNIKPGNKTSIYPHYNLTFEDIVMTDLGAYQVVFDNGLTPMLKHQFFIVAQGPPEVPSTVNIESATLTHDSLLIKWNGGFNGGLEQTFYIQYRPTSDTTWTTLEVTDTREATMNITITGLNPGTSYEVRVYAGNGQGNSSTSEPLQFKTSEKPTTNSADGVVIGVIVGIVAALILIAVGAFIIIRQRTNSVLGVCGLKRKENDQTNQYQNVVYTNEKDRGKSIEESSQSNQYECLDQSNASLPRIYDDLVQNTSNERPQYESLRGVTDNDRTYDRLQKSSSSNDGTPAQMVYENLRVV